MSMKLLFDYFSPIQTNTKYRTIDYRTLRDSYYLSEGNSSLVVSLPRERKVLRLRKSDPNNGNEACKDDGEERVRLAVDFHKNIIYKFLGVFAPKPNVVRCNAEDLHAASKLYEPHRPEKRRGKRVIETFATIFPDYTRLPANLLEKLPSDPERSTFCVEIKPKEGHIDDSLPNGAMCEFCSMRYAPSPTDLWSSGDAYCPCDIFSADGVRIRQALQGLLMDPRNNFKIFKNGKLVWGEGFEISDFEKTSLEWFGRRNNIVDPMLHLMVEALTSSFPECNFSPNGSQIVLDHEDWADSGRNTVLGRILYLQKLHRRSLSSVYPIYSRYSGILNDRMVYNGNLNGKNERTIATGHKDSSMDIPDESDLRELRDYLVYRVLRDCSILMTFREIDSVMKQDLPPENVLTISKGQCFLFNISIADLDPKSVHCIEKHRRAFVEPSKEIRGFCHRP